MYYLCNVIRKTSHHRVHGVTQSSLFLCHRLFIFNVGGTERYTQETIGEIERRLSRSKGGRASGPAGSKKGLPFLFQIYSYDLRSFLNQVINHTTAIKAQAPPMP